MEMEEEEGGSGGDFSTSDARCIAAIASGRSPRRLFCTAASARGALKIGLQFVTRAVYWSQGVRPVIMCRSLGHLVVSNTADIHT